MNSLSSARFGLRPLLGKLLGGEVDDPVRDNFIADTRRTDRRLFREPSPATDGESRRNALHRVPITETRGAPITARAAARWFSNAAFCAPSLLNWVGWGAAVSRG